MARKSIKNILRTAALGYLQKPLKKPNSNSKMTGHWLARSKFWELTLIRKYHQGACTLSTISTHFRQQFNPISQISVRLEASPLTIWMEY